MKKALILAGAVLLTGAMAVAATVTGNNVVTVIEKDAVVTGSGYQFLCMPIDPIDITGKADTPTVTTLAKFLNPASLNDGAAVTLGDKVYQVKTPESGVPAWYEGDTETVANDVAINRRQNFWLKDATYKGTETSVKPLFVGEVAQTGVVTGESGTLLASGVVGSEPVSIKTTFTTDNFSLRAGSSCLYRLQKGSNNYLVYYYDGPDCGWTVRKPHQWTRVPIGEDEVLQAGEAFYIQHVSRNP